MKTKRNIYSRKSLTGIVISALLAMTWLTVFTDCSSTTGARQNKYVVSPVRDTITILLPDRDDEFCEVRIYGNGARFIGSDYVVNGCVKFDVRSLPAGLHRILIHSGDLLTDETFVKR